MRKHSRHCQSQWALYLKIGVHGGPSIHPDGRDLPAENWDLTALQSVIEKHFPGVEDKPSITESCIYTVSRPKQLEGAHGLKNELNEW